MHHPTHYRSTACYTFIISSAHLHLGAQIKGSGEVILTSGGYLTLTTMMSMNDALSHVGIKVSEPCV